MDGEKIYSVEEAAWILKATPGRIRPMLRAGELEGYPSERLANFSERRLDEVHVGAKFRVEPVRNGPGP